MSPDPRGRSWLDALVGSPGDRLFVLALLVGAGASMHVLISVVSFVGDASARRVIALEVVAASFVLLISAIVAWMARALPADEERVYWVALSYLLPVAFAAGIIRHAEPWSAEPRGWAGVSVVMVLVPVFVRASPSRVLFATLSMATAGLAAYLFTILLGNTIVRVPWLLPLFRGEILGVALSLMVALLIPEREAGQTQPGGRLGAYDLKRRLGKGGMGEVWVARHSMMARPAVIKIIRPDHLHAATSEQKELMLARFEREVKATATLTCPHTITVYDYGHSDGLTFYYAMELLEGTDLHAFVTRYGPMPEARVVHLLRQACLSLAEAHDRGLVHRDIKPSNLFMCRYGNDRDYLKVLDWGLVALNVATPLKLTVYGQPMGTPGYMAPEQGRGDQQVDRRADLYSIGCVAYFLLTATHVFDDKSRTALIEKQLQEEPQPPSQRVNWPIHQGLERLVMQCLSVDPERRPQSAEELHDRLAALQFETPWTRLRAASWWQEHEGSLVMKAVDT